MDADVYKEWLKNIPVSAVRARTSLPVALVVDNCAVHSKMNLAQFKTIPLPPNVTSNHQPFDKAIIVALKRGYKVRLLVLVVEAFERTRQARLAGAGNRPGTSGGGRTAVGAPAIGIGISSREPG